MNDINAIFEQLKKIQPQAIILFGSQARGDVNKDSDMDILLIKKTNQSFSDRIKEIRSRIRTKIAIDLIVLTPEEAALMRQKSTFPPKFLKRGKSFMEEYETWLSKAKEDLLWTKHSLEGEIYL